MTDIPVLSAAAGDQLNTAGKEHDAVHNKARRDIGKLFVLTDAAIDPRSYAGWDDTASDHATQFAAALADAKSGSGGRTVLLPPLLKLASNHNTEGVHVLGRGSHQGGGGSKVQLTAAPAGLTMGDLTGTQRAGSYKKFFVDAQGIATTPVQLGLVTNPSMHRVFITGSAGTGLLLKGTQNADILQVSALNSATDGLQVDRAGGCAIYKSEFGASGRYNGSFVSGGPSLPFTVDYPLSNRIYDTLFEYHTSTTVAMFYQGAGLDNALIGCQFPTSQTPTTAALRLIILEQAGAPFSSDFRLVDAVLVHNFAAANTVGIDIIGAQSRFLGYGYHKITGSNVGIRRNDNTGGAVSYFGNVITAGVTTNKSTPAGLEGWINATFM